MLSAYVLALISSHFAPASPPSVGSRPLCTGRWHRCHVGRRTKSLSAQFATTRPGSMRTAVYDPSPPGGPTVPLALPFDPIPQAVVPVRISPTGWLGSLPNPIRHRLGAAGGLQPSAVGTGPPTAVIRVNQATVRRAHRTFRRLMTTTTTSLHCPHLRKDGRRSLVVMDAGGGGMFSHAFGEGRR